MSQKPEIPQGYEWIWKAFLILNQTRQSGVAGPLPFAFHDLVSYTASIYGRYFDEEDEEDFFYLIKVLDSAWLEEWFKRNKSNTTSSKGGHHGR